MLHRVEMPQRRRGVAGDLRPCVRGSGNGLREVAVVAAASVKMIYQRLYVLRVTQPSAFHDVKRGGVVEIGVRMTRPWHIVQKLRHIIALRTDVSDVRAVQLPAVVIHALDVWIVDLEEGNVCEKPPCVVAKILFG